MERRIREIECLCVCFYIWESNTSVTLDQSITISVVQRVIVDLRVPEIELQHIVYYLTPRHYNSGFPSFLFVCICSFSLLKKKNKISYLKSCTIKKLMYKKNKCFCYNKKSFFFGGNYSFFFFFFFLQVFLSFFYRISIEYNVLFLLYTGTICLLLEFLGLLLRFQGFDQ